MILAQALLLHILGRGEAESKKFMISRLRLNIPTFFKFYVLIVEDCGGYK